ncbi:MAG: chromosome segregation protein SMC [Candidatus Micrarchaeota archaeon]|nr:chromosome segregation protein SMC [Candidatus Micrarchaeota archaeon]
MVLVLYLKSMSIDKFKSFKHISVMFNRGFNCIVGPNGSGKSNIIDALMFSLGESSLHRLRVDRLQYLIREGSSRGPVNAAKAHVKLEFGGDEKIEVVRGIRADGKTVYRLNGKRMTRQEVLEVLKSHHVHIDETSTIAQGEINKIIEANAKQRREFIDIAAGIQEFEYKKKEALSELEKVGVRISTAQAMLNERLTFLNELAKEKEAAENYLLMSKRLKSINYSILVKRQKASQVNLDAYVKELGRLETEKKAVEEKVAEYAKKISALSEERRKIQEMLTSNTTTQEGVNKKLAEVSNELSALEVKITTGSTTIDDAAKLVAAIKEEIKGSDEKARANEAEIAELSSRLSELEPQVKKLGSSQSAGESGKRVKELDAGISALEKEFSQAQEKLARLQADRTLADARKEGSRKELERLGVEIGRASASVNELKEKIQSEKSKKEQADKKASELRARTDELRSTLSAADSEIISLKEQRAASHSRDSVVQSKLAAAFAGHPGFFGTVAELCGYDAKYAEAVEAAAGSRFNYFVVESMDVAGEMIQYLKKQNLGRATFVPLQELRVEAESKEKGLQAVTDLLKYDQKFGKVFSYIFSNTYLVRDVEEAKAVGTGRHRYITLTGETVERAGVLSGGSRLKALPIAALEKKLKDVEETRGRAFAEAKDVDARYFNCRKESAEAEIEMASANSSMVEYSNRIKEYGLQKSKLESELALAEKDSKKIAADLGNANAAATQLSNDLEGRKRERSETYTASLEAARKGMRKEDAERLDGLKKDIESVKIKSAELQRENKMLAEARQQKSRELDGKNELIEKTKKLEAEYSKKKDELLKSKAEVESHMRRSSKSNRDALERQEAIAKDLDKLLVEQTSQNARSDNISRQASDVAVKRGQTEMRMNDIAAELSAYDGAKPEMLNEDIEKMEKEAQVLGAKIEALGNVNLKAPEAYEEKSRSVNEATEKVETLEGEKKAVLAMIEEIDSKKLNAFLTTFGEVSKNFSKLYNYIYPGKARIELDDQNDPLVAGLSIKVEDANFVGQSRGLSGGQKSLLSLMLLFSIHMCKPSSLYLFDEIDSALDKENSKKLSQLIKGMAKDAQFVVVSHNDSLIVNADVALGVAKSGGDSQVYGIEISNVSKK